MIFIRGNWLGLGMFLLSGLVALLFGFILKFGDFITMISVGISLTFMDLIFRTFFNKEINFFRKDKGGYFFFVPVWILGIIVILINLINSLGVFK